MSDVKHTDHLTPNASGFRNFPTLPNSFGPKQGRLFTHLDS